VCVVGAFLRNMAAEEHTRVHNSARLKAKGANKWASPLSHSFSLLSRRAERDSLASIVRRAAPSGRTARVSQTIQARRTSRYPFALICYFLLSFEDNSFHCFQLNSTCLGRKNVTMLKTTFSVAKSVYWSQ
jgi:hypothetical protein